MNEAEACTIILLFWLRVFCVAGIAIAIFASCMAIAHGGWMRTAAGLFETMKLKGQP